MAHAVSLLSALVDPEAISKYMESQMKSGESGKAAKETPPDAGASVLVRCLKSAEEKPSLDEAAEEAVRK